MSAGQIHFSINNEFRNEGQLRPECTTKSQPTRPELDLMSEFPPSILYSIVKASPCVSCIPEPQIRT